MSIKIKNYLKDRGGSLEQKPTRMKHKTFEALQKRHFDYYETKYSEAKRKEFIEWYPDKLEELEEFDFLTRFNAEISTR